MGSVTDLVWDTDKDDEGSLVVVGPDVVLADDCGVISAMPFPKVTRLAVSNRVT